MTAKLTKILADQYKYALSTGDINNLPIQPLYEAMQNLYKDAARVWGNRVRLSINKEVVKKSLGSMGYNEQLLRLIEQFFRLDFFQYVTQINDTTRAELEKIFSEGFAQGLNLAQIADRIEVLGLVRYRAKMIARTEVNTAANRGALIAAQATGLPLKKEWLATMDKRTRDTHKHIDGTTIPFDDMFKVGNDMLECPGDRGGKDGRPKTSAKETINCRCTCLFIPIE
jgi:SPP1 gp7 family putative phage head morphogenesis protein